jgi:hypothetical protein
MLSNLIWLQIIKIQSKYTVNQRMSAVIKEDGYHEADCNLPGRQKEPQGKRGMKSKKELGTLSLLAFTRKSWTKPKGGRSRVIKVPYTGHRAKQTVF